MSDKTSASYSESVRRAAILLTSFSLLSILTYGVIVHSDELDAIACIMARDCPVDTLPLKQQPVLEGIGPNLIAMLMFVCGLKGAWLHVCWNVLGYGLLAVTVAVVLVKRRIAPWALAAAFLTSRIIETLQLWVSKADPYLLACLIGMAVAGRGKERNALAALGALCHAPVAVLTAGAIVFAEWVQLRRFDLPLCLSVAAGFVAAKAGVHFLVPAFSGRFDFVSQHFADQFQSMLPYTVGFFAIALSGVAAVLLTGAASPLGPAEGRAAAAVGGILLAWTALSEFVVEDHSRVFSLLSCPLLCWAINALDIRPLRLTELALIGLITLSAPQFSLFLHYGPPMARAFIPIPAP